MQIGVFSVSDITQNPITKYTPSEAERIQNIVKIAVKAEEVGFDVFGIGEHHNSPFFSSSPTTTLAYIAAQTKKLILTTATTLITTNDPVRIAEEYAMLQHLAQGRMDLMLGRGNTVPVYDWFGKDIYKSLDIALENYSLLNKLWREDVVSWQGKYRSPLNQFTSTPRPLDGVPPFVWHGSIRTPEIAVQAAYYKDGFFANNLFYPKGHFKRLINLYKEKFAQYHGSADDAVVGLGGQVFVAKNSQDAIKQFRPYFDNAPVYGHDQPLEKYMDATPLGVGSPAEIIDKLMGYREQYGDYQRLLLLIDHAGLPIEMVLEQLEMLGAYVLPTLRKEMEAVKAPNVKDAPTHAARLDEICGGRPKEYRPNPNRGDNVTGTSPYRNKEE